MKTTSLISILPIIFLLFSTTYGKVIYVDSTASDQQNTYPSIQKAINAATAGDEVIIKKGSYAENIIVKIPLSLRGELNEVVTITGNPDSKNATLCEVNNVTGCSLENIIFNPSGGGATKEPVVHLKGGTVTVKNCTVEKAKAVGISCSNGCKALITNCTVKKSQSVGLSSEMGQTHVKINGSHFLNNKHSGVYLGGETLADISNCVFKDNGVSGVKAAREGSHVSLKDSKFVNNRGSGVSISGGASGDVQGCEFNSNKIGIFGGEIPKVSITNNQIEQSKEHGIRLHKVQISMLSHNLCKNNGRNGIYIHGGAESTLSENTCLQNKECGFSFRGKKLKVEAKKNISRENKWQGFYASDGVEGLLIENEVVANGLNGISVTYSDISVQKNKCTDNRYSGIYIAFGSMSLISSNICNENHSSGIFVGDLYSAPTLSENITKKNKSENLYIEQKPLGRIREKVLKGQYDELEQLVGDLQKEEKRNANGGWLAWQFYGFLSEKTNSRSKENQEAYDAAVKKWITLKPESATPRIILAKIYVFRGWHYRGTGMADTVTEEGWKQLSKYLNMAVTILDEAEKLQDQDPELYLTYLLAGKGLSKPREWMEEKFKKGISIQSNYHYLYTEMMQYLQPKWHGNREEMLAFTERACQLTKEKEGNTMYSRIVGSSLHGNTGEGFMSFGFPYDKIKSSYEELLERYPQSYRNMNRLCLIACMNEDRQTARKMFELMKDNYHRDIWKNDDGYVASARHWAFAEDNPTEDTPAEK